MIRWRTHRYTLGHSLCYFQTDFAGRLAQPHHAGRAGAPRDGGQDPRFAALRRDLRLDGARPVHQHQPDARRADGGVDRRLHGADALLRAAGAGRSLKNAEARSVAVGRIVDSYTNILTVKLFARAEEERSAVRRALAAWTRSFLDLFRLITGVDATLSVMNSVLIVDDRRLVRLSVDARRDDERAGGDRPCAGDAHRRDVGLGDAGRARRVREHRRHPGEHGDDRPAARHRRRAGRASRSRCRAARSASRTSASTTAARTASSTT